MKPLRRFIAAAVCPACKKTDKLFVYTEDGNNVCECVACGFRDVQSRDAQPGSEQFRRALGADDAVETVRIIDPSSP